MRSIVYYYTHVPAAFEQVATPLSGDPGTWLPAPAEASPSGWLVTLHADGAVPQPLADHPAHVRVGPTSGNAATLRRRVTWRSAVTGLLVPTLEADLELAPLNGYGCQLSLMGSYPPPLSVAGAVGDRLLGHRVAEACVRRFVLGLAERLEATTLHQ